MDHLDGVDETGDGVKHAHRITLVEWFAQLLQGVEVL